MPLPDAEPACEAVDAGALQPVEKPHTVRRLAAVDTAPLRAQVARLSDRVWNRESAARENDFFCFAHTRHVVFRFIPLDAARLRYYVNPGWDLWRRWLLPVMAQASAPYGYAEPVYPKAMLARLAAGRGIDPHTDCGGMNPFTHKIHVPLETTPRATLAVAGAAFHLEAGYAWEVNNLADHGAFNGGGQDRIHFIFEVLEGAGMEWRWSRRPVLPRAGAHRCDPPAHPAGTGAAAFAPAPPVHAAPSR